MDPQEENTMTQKQGKATLITPQTQEVVVGEGASLGDVLGGAGVQVDLTEQWVTVDNEPAEASSPVEPGAEIIVSPAGSMWS